MKVNELRVGNLVCGKTQFGELVAKICQISEVLCGIEPIDSKIANGEWFACKIDEGEFKLIEPIQLTEEFFTRNGFIEQAKCDATGTYFRSEVLRTESFGTPDEWLVYIEDDHYITVFCKHLKYVHELQNAYYISTGKELEVKL